MSTSLITPSEDAHQASFVAQFRIKYKDHIIFAIPNGGNRSPREAALLKQTGTLAGIPDLCILCPNGKTIFIEMKKENGKLSKVQKELIPKIELLGFKVLICYGYKDALEQIKAIL